MVRYSIVLAESARNDLNSIVEYIGVRLKEPAAAIRLYNGIKEKILSLSEMPSRINPVQDKYLADKGYRKIIAENYYIFFKINEPASTVEVVRIVYNKRNWVDIV